METTVTVPYIEYRELEKLRDAVESGKHYFIGYGPVGYAMTVHVADTAQELIAELDGLEEHQNRMHNERNKYAEECEMLRKKVHELEEELKSARAWSLTRWLRLRP